MGGIRRLIRHPAVLGLGISPDGCSFFPMRMPALERTDDCLRRIIGTSSNPHEIREAANSLARRVGFINDAETLGNILRLSDDQQARKAALEKLSGMVGRISDVRVLEIILMNATEPALINRAADMLAARIDDVTSAFSLIHIALNSKSREARAASVMKLEGKKEPLAVIAEHSAFDDTKRLARGMMPVPNEPPRA